jgi:hypothetical protein
MKVILLRTVRDSADLSLALQNSTYLKGKIWKDKTVVSRLNDTTKDEKW